MKKLLFLVMLTSMFGTAHATRSRMNSLGQDPNQGSFYLMDNRDFFRNPANAAKMRNFMVAELAQNYAAAGSTPTESNLEGGYFGEFSSDMAFGVYLGKQNVAVDTAAAVASGTVLVNTAFLTSGDANPINLFLGGGSDMKWGINLGYANTEDKMSTGKNDYNSLGLAAGIETNGGLQVYASYNGATSKLNSTGYNKLESTPLTVGVIYGLNAETTIFGQYNAGTTKVTGGGGAATPEQKFDNTQFILGIGRIYELSPTARFNFDLSWNMAQSENKNAPAGYLGYTKATKNTLPLVIGLEADAAEWLILRASVRENFILGNYKLYTKTTTTTSSMAEDIGGTRVALGATLHFGKLKIDGNLGGFGGQKDQSLFDATNMFVNAAATYMF